MLNEASKALNFKYIILNPEVPSWGILRDDGKWDGLMNLPMDNIADLIISNVHIEFSRTQVIKYRKLLPIT